MLSVTVWVKASASHQYDYDARLYVRNEVATRPSPCGGNALRARRVRSTSDAPLTEVYGDTHMGVHKRHDLALRLGDQSNCSRGVSDLFFYQHHPFHDYI